MPDSFIVGVITGICLTLFLVYITRAAYHHIINRNKLKELSIRKTVLSPNSLIKSSDFLPRGFGG